MRILVTGGAGFIGSVLVKKLIQIGHQVIIIDDLSNGKKNNIHPDATFYYKNIQDTVLLDIIKQEKISHVFHLAAQVNVLHSVKNPLFDAKTNILGLINLLTACHQAQIKKVIYASSAAVYGTPYSLPISEDHPISPISAYGLSKYCGELYLHWFNQIYGLTYTIFRYANVYGTDFSHSLNNSVVSIFLKQIQNGHPPTIYGDGHQTRDFIYIDDVVEANISALTRGNNQTYNISSNTQTSIHELFTLITEILESDLHAEFQPKRFGEIQHNYLDHSRSLHELSWKPKFSLKAGLMQLKTLL